MIQVDAERLAQITNPLVMNSEHRCFFVIRIFEHSVKRARSLFAKITTDDTPADYRHYRRASQKCLIG